MRKHDESLFQIGEVTRILGITRKTLLVYERMGVLTPAVKDKTSGFRYYTADNMTQIRSIRSLQSLGLSLKEVAAYYSDTSTLDQHLQRLLALRAELDKNIHMLQMRSAKQGDLSIHRTSLPRQVCFCRRYACADTAEAVIRLRETYIAAAHTGKMSPSGHMFTVRTSQNPEVLKLLCCIPMEEDFDGSERLAFAETEALCIYYRGPYEGTGAAIQTLNAYLKQNGTKAAGDFRSIYLEGPPNRGEHKEDYITQIAVPIQGIPETRQS